MAKHLSFWAQQPGTPGKPLILVFALLLIMLAACAAPTPTPAPTPARRPEPGPTGVPLPPSAAINLDAETQTLIARAPRTVFLIPFSHWDTDWHLTYAAYAEMADGNIAAAIRLAQSNPRFRYTFEQVLFVQHFWETHPEQRAALAALVRNGQLTFAWAGITQPDTSLVAPVIQVRNLLMGQEWIAQTFGVAPRSAWQSDAFGNSASLPLFLNAFDIPFVYMGRGPGVCESAFRCSSPMPASYYWATPADPDVRVLAAYLFYSNAYWSVAQLQDPGAQLDALRALIEREMARGAAKYLLLPMGADFADPLPYLPDLVERWNQADPKTPLVMADPETAFHYLASLDLPQYTTDLNPIWQGFYGTRPAAKIADKESEAFLTAADKFGLLTGAPASAAWVTATINAHYDNIAGVSFDAVWEESQRPRYEQTVAAAADNLAQILAQVSGRVAAPLVIFNPTSWPRSEVIELQGPLPPAAALPAFVQRLGPDHVALWIDAAPAVGYTVVTQAAPTPANPATLARSGRVITLSNGLVSVALDGDHGGAMTSLSHAGDRELIAGYGDDVVYITDHGDVYGAFLGEEQARASHVPASMTVVATGPLLARAQAVVILGGQPVTRTVTVRANSPLVEVVLEIAALPETTAIVQTATTLSTTTRTDDVGFSAFTHPVDDSPIVSGTVTYRREVFYPITAWGDVSAGGAGLSVLTHGLQGLGGVSTLNLLLVRQVFDKGNEGVTDAGVHTLRYAYLPHAGSARDAQVWLAATAFNQPLIPAWPTGGGIHVQLPFMAPHEPYPFAAAGLPLLPRSLSLIEAADGVVADLYRREGRIEALILSPDPRTPITLTIGGQQRVLPAAAVVTQTVDLILPP